MRSFANYRHNMSEEERGSEGIEARTEEDESMSGASVQAEILVKNAVKKK